MFDSPPDIAISQRGNTFFSLFLPKCMAENSFKITMKKIIYCKKIVMEHDFFMTEEIFPLPYLYIMLYLTPYSCSGIQTKNYKLNKAN